MSKNITNILTESERNRIKSLYETPISNDVVITNWLSPDEKYVIFLDNLIEIKTKTNIGNIWENFDYLKMFLKHSFEVSTTITEEIRESVLNDINNLVIVENKRNLFNLKETIKELYTEGYFSNALDWVKETGANAVNGVKDFISTSIKGGKDLISKIGDSEWIKVINLIKQGSLYVARKIRQALYHPVGMIIDAVLIATGIGKGLQIIPWAIAVGLDVHEYITKDYEDPSLSDGFRALFFGVDCLGLVSTGVIAKSFKSPLTNLIKKFGSSEQGFIKALNSSTFLKNLVTKISSNLNKVVDFMNKCKPTIDKSPILGKWFSSIFNKIGSFVKWIYSVITSTVKTGYKVISAPGKLAAKVGGKTGKGLQAAVNVGGINTAIGTYTKSKENDLYNSIKNSTIESVYNINEL